MDEIHLRRLFVGCSELTRYLTIGQGRMALAQFVAVA
jgi:hypothetical protein